MLAEFERWVDIINAEKPDLVLVAGDIIDGSRRPLKDENVAEAFRQIEAPIYACLGNHEYYADKVAAETFCKTAGINLLVDSIVSVKGINIVGRDDRTNLRRKSLGDIMKSADKSLYTVLLDHQPHNLDEARLEGIDFQFSGHTHHGQVWPVSWITDAIYENAYGPLTNGKTQYFVSSGIGIWGGKFRIGTQSEYIVARLER